MLTVEKLPSPGPKVLKFSDLRSGELFVTAEYIGKSSGDDSPWLKTSDKEAIFLWYPSGSSGPHAEPYPQDREVIRAEGELTWRIP